MTTANAESFHRLLTLWREAAQLLAAAKEAYRLAHAQAYISTTGTDSVRKANADVQTTALRLTRDQLEVEERASYHYMIALRGSAGEPVREEG
jgi:hypothetical protein